jgi:hypothetical protein
MYIPPDISFLVVVGTIKKLIDRTVINRRRHAVGQSNVAVGAYATDIAVENGVLRTTHFREEFRKTGPSNYFHGKPEHDTNVSV